MWHEQNICLVKVAKVEKVVALHEKPEPGKNPCTTLPTKAPCKGGGAPVPATGGIKPKRLKPGVVVLHEIRRFQKSVDLLIPLLSFSCLIWVLAQDFKVNLHFQSSALMAIQEAAETFLVNLFEAANLCCIYHKWETIAPKDLHLVKAICHISGIDLWWV